jgi:GDP-L-fucose synthase
MTLQGKRVLIAGSTGLIGSNLTARLVREGALVRATLHRRAPVIVDDRVEYVTCDLTLGEDCRRVVEGVEVVYLCAANSSGAAMMAKDPMAHVTPNVLINAQMLEAAWYAGVEKLVWFASTTGYPPSGDRPVREEEMFSGEPYETYFFVGWMKRFTEKLCEMYGAKLPRRMTTVVLRPTNVYGMGDDFEFETSHVIPALVRRVVERHDPVEVWGSGDEIRDMIHVDDMVDAILLATQKLDRYDVFNIGSGQGVSIREILGLILEIDGYPDARVKFDPSKPTAIPVRLVDISKARRVLGFEPRVDLRAGLRQTIEWYRGTRRSRTVAPRP